MIRNYTYGNTELLGHGLYELLQNLDNLNGLELLITSNSGITETIFLDSIKTMKIYKNYVVIFGLNENRVFLNLNNVLSVSIVGEIL